MVKNLLLSLVLMSMEIDYPTDKKVYFYFPIDDNVRSEAVAELFASYLNPVTAKILKEAASE